MNARKKRQFIILLFVFIILIVGGLGFWKGWQWIKDFKVRTTEETYYAKTISELVSLVPKDKQETGLLPNVNDWSKLGKITLPPNKYKFNYYVVECCSFENGGKIYAEFENLYQQKEETIEDDLKVFNESEITTFGKYAICTRDRKNGIISITSEGTKILIILGETCMPASI